MQRFLRLTFIFAVLLAILVFMPQAHPVSAESGCLAYSGLAGVSFPVTIGHTYKVYDSHGALVDTFTASGPTWAVCGCQGMVKVYDISETCSDNDTSWFNPGDGRISPRPNDRLAVYCNINPASPIAGTVAVYGILDNGNGVSLALFNYTEVLKAGAGGISKNVSPYGQVSISALGDGVSYTATWSGGPASATGAGDFQKTFICTFE